MKARVDALSAVVFVTALALAGCNCGVSPAASVADDGGSSSSSSESSDGGSASTGGNGGSTTTDAGDNPFLNDAGQVQLPDGGSCVQVSCQSHVYMCADCIDNDGDGLIDSADPDCLGACQNNESGFAGNIPGQNNAPCKQDCYFDQDTGAGNDSCNWNHQCDPLEPEQGCNYNGAMVGGQSCPEPQSAACTSGLCPYLTPNGCDCFGCCELPSGSGRYVWLGSFDSSGAKTCTLAAMNDDTMCKPCTPVPSCLNGCGRCEICIGKPEPDPSCGTTSSDGGTGGGGGDAGVETQCPAGVQPCGLPGQAACPTNHYCVTGCCQPTMIN